LLAVLIEEALAVEFLVITWPVVRAKAEERGMTAAAIEEAFAALTHKRYLKVRSIAGGPHTVELSEEGPQPVQLVDIADPDGVNQRTGVLASLIIAHPGLAAVIRALVNLWPAGPDDTSSRQAGPGR